MSAIDWGAALRTGLRLGLPPREFWTLSLAEWRALTGPATAMPDPAAIARLRARFPDKEDTNARDE